MSYPQPVIPDFRQAHVLVVGDIMLDRYWHGATSRISPEAPVPVIDVRAGEERPGGAGNVARNLAALGARVTLIGLTGDDEAAANLEARLRADGVVCRFMRKAEHATITKLRVVSRQQQLLRLDFEDGCPGVDGTALAREVQAGLQAVDVLLLSDYGKGTLAAIEPLIRLAHTAGKPVLVDPARGADFARYRQASALTPNLAEFEAVAGPSLDEGDFHAHGEALRAELGLQALLVTQSDKGMTLFENGEAPAVMPTRAREVFDVTGAGDTVIATLAAALASGVDWGQAANLANLAAGCVVSKLGTSTATVAELRQRMAEHEPLRRGVVSHVELESLLSRARDQGERIVMTNGCFDILHAGHVAHLAQAAALGDRLLVAVNDDASVARLKGASRPVNPLAQRMAMLAALESVDWVVPFTTDTPRELICELKPQVLVKGGGYAQEDIAGAACVEQAGGQVVILEHQAGFSTSMVIDAISKRV